MSFNFQCQVLRPIMSSDQISEESESSDGARPLCLDQFLKLAGICGTGGQAKVVIQGGEVRVNGAVETRRRRKLSAGDKVQYGGKTFLPDPWL